MVEATKMCRTCLKQNFEMLHLFSEVLLDKPALIKDILMNLTTIQVAKADGFPEMICSQCLRELKSAFSFKKMCETSDSTLRRNSAPPKAQNPIRIETEIDFVNVKPEPETEIQFVNVEPDPETNLDMEIEEAILDIKSEYENPSSTEPVHYIDDENDDSDVQVEHKPALNRIEESRTGLSREENFTTQGNLENLLLLPNVNQFKDKLKRKMELVDLSLKKKREREMATERNRRYRERKRTEAEQLNSNAQQQREMARERNRRYRERKRTNAKQPKSNAQQQKEMARERKRRYRERKRTEADQPNSNVQQQREMARERIRRYRERKRTEVEQPNSNVQQQKEMARECSRRYREKKKLLALKSVDHLIHDPQIPRSLHGIQPLVISNQRTTLHDSQIAGTSTNMDIPLFIRDDSKNVERVEKNCVGLSRVENFITQENQKNLFLSRNEENQPIDIDDK